MIQGHEQAMGAADSAGASLRGRRIGVSYESSVNLFCRDLTAGVREAAAARGVEVLIRESAHSSERQVADVAGLLADGVDALVISPEDPTALTAVIAAAEERHIPVFTVDRAADGPVVTHVTSDNLLGGRLAAGFLIAALEAQGTVAVVGLQGMSSVADRVAGFRETLAAHPGLRLVAEVNGDSDRRRARAVTTEVLHAHPRLSGLFAVNDVMAQGVLEAIRDVGREESVVVVGYDATPQGCEEMMRGGPLRAEVAQFPVRIGHTVVDVWADYLRGALVPRRVEIPVELVTRENVGAFTGAERLLHTRRGEVWTAGERVIFFPVRGYQMMLNEIHAASPDLLRHIVYRSGFVLGESIASQVQDLYPDPHDRLFVLLEDLCRGGFGTFEIVSLDVAAGRAEVRGDNLFEATIAPGLAWARTPRAVDTYCSGRLAGYLTAIVGRPAVCEEVLCQARGDAYCQFAITVEER